MLVFDDASHAVSSVLELLEQARDRGLPPLHAGIGAGPLVRRDGDYFGTVVNLASRTADYARPDEVLVSQAVVDAWTGKEVRFQAIGSIALKGISDPVALSQAVPA
jgi:adenylate cyclase